MEIALSLLRALPSLDCAWTSTTGRDYSIEVVLNAAIARPNPPLPSDNCFGALRAVVAGVRAAGGWRAYDRKPRAEILRLRSLALRRRAVFLPSTTRRYDYPYIRSLVQRGRAGFLPSTTRHYDYAYIRSLQFLVRCPPEIAWHVLGYWRCQYRHVLGCFH